VGELGVGGGGNKLRRGVNIIEAHYINMKISE
jgi:hypothetical protein